MAGRLAWCRPYSSPITLHGIRGSSHRRAGKMPAVRLRRADVVRVGACRSYRLSIHSRHARSIYTIRLVPTPSERLSISADGRFIRSFTSSRVAPGSCSAQLKVPPWEMALRSSGRNRYPVSSPIFWRFFRKSFSSAARRLDEFGIVGHYGCPDTSGHLPWRQLGREGKTLPHLRSSTWCPTC